MQIGMITNQRKALSGISPDRQWCGLRKKKKKKEQTITANSTTVAEWCALDQPCRDAVWLNKIASSFQLPEYRPTGRKDPNREGIQNC
jgi:hypothetical protein